jgi:hypothetical protein
VRAPQGELSQIEARVGVLRNGGAANSVAIARAGLGGCERMTQLEITVASRYATSPNVRRAGGLLEGIGGKALLASYVICVGLAWCIIRSHYLGDGMLSEAGTGVPVAMRVLIFLALIVPTVFVLRKDTLTAWFVGLSVAGGTVPSLPLLPFFQDYTHVVVILWAVILSFTPLKEKSDRPLPLFILCFIFFMIICAISWAVNFWKLGNVWQAKIGIVYLVQYGALAVILYSVATRKDEVRSRFHALLDGFVWGAFGQALLSLIGVSLLFYLPYAQGNDTIFGLSYYDRFKSTFHGPVALGMFFLSSLPLVLLWMHRRGSGGMTRSSGWIAMVYCQLLPWFMMATGSRTARVMSVATMGMLLATPKTRRAALILLPSTFLAYYLGFTYQSAPSAVSSFLGNKESLSNNLAGRFFEVSDRLELTMEAFTAIKDSTLMAKLIGFGPGTGGYRISGFPEPHNMIFNEIAQTGVLGFTAMLCFLLAIALPLLRQASVRPWQPAKVEQPGSITAWLLLVTLVTFESVNGTYDPAHWGLTMFIVLLTACGLCVIRKNFHGGQPVPIFSQLTPRAGT